MSGLNRKDLKQRILGTLDLYVLPTHKNGLDMEGNIEKSVAAHALWFDASSLFYANYSLTADELRSVVLTSSYCDNLSAEYTRWVAKKNLERAKDENMHYELEQQVFDLIEQAGFLDDLDSRKER